MTMLNKKITLYENSNQYVNAAIDKIVVEIFNKQKPNGKAAQMILMLGASPLAGTTSTSIDLAIASASTGRKILLVDCDVRKSEKYKKLNEEAETGLADYLLQDTDQSSLSGLKVSEILYSTNVKNLAYIPCGSYTANPTRVMCSSRLEPLMNELKENFDYIICDLPCINIVPDAQVLFPMADGIILVTALDETRKSNIREAKNKIEPFAEKCYGMIINKISPEVYRKSVKNYDYYLPDIRGGQKLGRSSSQREYEKKIRTEKRTEERLIRAEKRAAERAEKAAMKEAMKAEKEAEEKTK